MELKDYIKYYIGQKCLDSYSGEITEITGVTLADGFTVIITNHNVNQGRKDFEIKPILRQLSDLKEEEMKELIKLSGVQYRFDEIDICDLDGKRIDFVDGSKWCGDGVEEFNEFVVNLSELNPAQFHYLLQLGMDLWNLIDSNLAIDSSTVKK